MQTEEIVAGFENGIAAFELALNGLPPEVLDRAPAPGKWSMRQIAAHVADAEVLGATRMRFLVAEPHKVLNTWDQDKWADSLRYCDQPVEHSLTLFRTVRSATAAMLRRLSAECWERQAVHEQTGQVCLRELVRHYTDHAEHHIRQIAELRVRFATATLARRA
jgi:hypothetical protein